MTCFDFDNSSLMYFNILTQFRIVGMSSEVVTAWFNSVRIVWISRKIDIMPFFARNTFSPVVDPGLTLISVLVVTF